MSAIFYQIFIFSLNDSPSKTIKKFFISSKKHAMAVLGYLPKLKRSLGIAFGADFLHDVSIKVFLI